jgi:hypothetical protein
MSAIRQSPPSAGPAHDGKVIGTDHVTYTYSQPVPIPSYLIAIAVGNVRYRAFPSVPGRKWSTGIWAEPEFIDAAYWEFSEDTNRLVEWDHYRRMIMSLWTRSDTCNSRKTWLSRTVLACTISWFFHRLSRMAAWCVKVLPHLTSDIDG